MPGPEKTFENKIKKYFNDRGAWVLKTWSNGIQRSGVPDLLICYKGQFIALEVKAENGHPSDLQLYNIQKLNEAGAIAMVIYPKDWEDFKERMEKF